MEAGWRGRDNLQSLKIDRQCGNREGVPPRPPVTPSVGLLRLQPPPADPQQTHRAAAEQDREAGDRDRGRVHQAGFLFDKCDAVPSRSTKPNARDGGSLYLYLFFLNKSTKAGIAKIRT